MHKLSLLILSVMFAAFASVADETVPPANNDNAGEVKGGDPLKGDNVEAKGADKNKKKKETKPAHPKK
jgi:hypothetical protein